jgi:hypothetical protein
MAPRATSIFDEFGIALGNLADAATGSVIPSLRLGVTGLSRSGKTVFITALIHNLLTGGRLPGFSALAEGRLIGARLSEAPDRKTPRFAFEQHLAALTGPEPVWPDSTRRISQLRLTLKYQSANWLSGFTGPSQLHLDIVDYPGEWLLDLPLLSMSFAEWSDQALARAEMAQNSEAKAFLKFLADSDLMAEASEPAAEALAKSFTAYLKASRDSRKALSTLPPGRFLMPGDLEGAAALTFAPLPVPQTPPSRHSLYAMLARRYEAYKSLVVRPFFVDHFARLDRQIVLVDALRPLNAGPDAVADLETALTGVLACFRQGANNPLTQLIARKIDKILFAATKADHLHHTSHDRLEAILQRLVANATRRARFHGAGTGTLAMAALRATREGEITHDGETLDCIVGTPLAGEELDGKAYDGKTEIALFPGDLPEKPDSVFEPRKNGEWVNFMRFAPPRGLQRNEEGEFVLPHIRLDRALEFLLGDRLK